MEPLNRLSEYASPVSRVLPLPAVALASVVSKDGQRVYASSDTLYKGAVFGRDSLQVAEDLMLAKPELAHNILLTLGQLQGSVVNNQNEEEPGKIIHEYRTVEVDGRAITGRQLQIFHDLAAKWGGSETELAYYGSVDATPHFLRVLGTYCQLHGADILDQSVTKRNGEAMNMHQVAEAAVAWLVGRLAASRSGLIEYQKQNPHGISNQAWKDSDEFYVHENGQRANHHAPIASIEVQGLGYDALMAAARLFPEQAEARTAQARALRDTTLALLWQEERDYFALGLDYGQDGEQRIIATQTANPGALLDSGFFDELDTSDRERYVQAIVNRLTAPDFLTNAGIRSRSLEEANLIPFWDYHGSYVSWPKETYDIAKGMRRQGLPALAKQLEDRLLNVVLKTRQYPEFVYVDQRGRVLGGAPSSQRHGELILVDGAITPERLQAWTVSAVYAIIARRKLKKSPSAELQEPWQKALEQGVLSHIPQVDLYLNPFKLWLEYPTYKYRLADKG